MIRHTDALGLQFHDSRPTDFIATMEFLYRYIALFVVAFEHYNIATVLCIRVHCYVSYSHNDEHNATMLDFVPFITFLVFVSKTHYYAFISNYTYVVSFIMRRSTSRDSLFFLVVLSLQHQNIF